MRACPAVVLILLTASPALATDIKVVRHSKVPMLGTLVESETSEWLSPTAKRVEGVADLKGGLIGTMAKLGGGPKQRITITRLDKGVVWTLDPVRKTYSERPIGLERDAVAANRGMQRRAQASLRVVDASFNVKDTGEERTINDFPCKQSLLDGFIELEDRDSHARSKWEFHSERWATPESAAMKRFTQTEREYAAAYAAKLGLDSKGSGGADAPLQGLAQATGVPPAELAQATAKFKAIALKSSGFVILNNFHWALSGSGSPTSGSDDKDGAAADNSGLVGLLSSMGGKHDGGPAGLSLQGSLEFRTLVEENGDFEIPEGYRKVEK